MTRYLGFSCSQHDPSVAVVDESGAVVFAEANERALKCKRGWHAPPDPFGVIGPILDAYLGDAPVSANLTWSRGALAASGPLSALSRVVLRAFEASGAPDADLWRAWYFRHALYRAPRSASDLLLNLDVRLRERRGYRAPVPKRAWSHHLCHAATASYSSPFDEALCVVLDGMGEGGSTAVYRFAEDRLTRLDARQWTNLASLGIFYSQVCFAIGFDPLAGEEWKVMGLAAYGTVDDELYALLRPVVEVRGERFRISRGNASWFERLLAMRTRGYRANADLAATAQRVFEDVLCEFLVAVHRKWPHANLILSGGCALNSSANGKVLASTPFERLHVPAAPGDDGNSVGAALLAWKRDHPDRTVPRCSSPYLGSRMRPESVQRLRDHGMTPALEAKSDDELTDAVARALAAGAIVGWVQGRAEFGPRALGHRSILADPRSPTVKERLNASVKFREEFRPFAPSILHEHGASWFEDYAASPYMERTLRWCPDRAPRGVRHVDGTGRLQSVTAEGSPLFHALISKFHALTGVPILLNTSFNVMGRPMVHDVEDVLGVFLTSDIDMVVIDGCVFRK